ncbi:MAG TPA: succinate dehydrogenase, partial [Polyangiaceae bacterium]|nr:succinate dehydrogenase [Polyangiaceae bacterium]
MTGVFPTGVFMLVELWTHAKALDGPAAHSDAIRLLAAGWIWPLLIGLPMAFHAGYGLWLAFRSRYTVARYPTSANWNYTLQRATGVVAAIFIGYHLATFWVPLRLGRVAPDEAFFLLSGHLSSTLMGIPLIGLGYALGLSACIYHFANGLRSFADRWGLAPTPRARAAAGVGAAGFGLALFVATAPVVVYVATGWRMVGEPVNVDATP